MPQEFTSLQQMLEHIGREAASQKRVTLSLVIRAVGRRSFAPLLLLVGLILFSPLSGIPGVPTIMAILVLLVAVQLLLGRHYFWLPQWLLRRSISEKSLQRALHFLQRPAEVSDRWLRPRFRFLVHRTGTYVIATICVVIALALPVMEVVPFSASLAGVALTTFGLALVAQDGLLAIIAFVLTGLTAALILFSLLSGYFAA
ncbi:exopolysaccharide biosynthesis protein [Microbulbifer flavimaris]|uniref:Exopolysaccharide biosynthesis protein n=1 Tax=Microbulbifer flavimaris TaxID=1781068 RepID=A0ABX4HWM6_9GAMM|nr:MULTISPECIES: exopolysaccharide biosynthesis protein [Microbulbifer]KUJ80262.1 exopolysaccharide biosynthesis protein [Microbulbifer sp. ZGT114]PCO04326.1 exopolysaccharide biosynthesis protein [Microbulbifer flavimaris]